MASKHTPIRCGRNHVTPTMGGTWSHPRCECPGRTHHGRSQVTPSMGGSRSHPHWTLVTSTTGGTTSHPPWAGQGPDSVGHDPRGCQDASHLHTTKSRERSGGIQGRIRRYIKSECWDVFRVLFWKVPMVTKRSQSIFEEWCCRRGWGWG